MLLAIAFYIPFYVRFTLSKTEACTNNCFELLEKVFKNRGCTNDFFTNGILKFGSLSRLLFDSLQIQTIAKAFNFLASENDGIYLKKHVGRK